MHSVRFYDDDKALTAALGRFAVHALERGHALLAVCSAARMAALRRALVEAKLDPDDLASMGAYVQLDMDELAGQPGDAAGGTALVERIGRPILDAAERFGGIAIFSELLTRHLESAQYEAALRLELLWRDLHARLPCELLSACLIDTLRNEAAEHLLENPLLAPLEVADGCEPPGDAPNQGPIGTLRRYAHALAREGALRRALEGLLVQRERELTDFLENGAEALHKLDAQGTILWANKAELDLLGYAKDEYVGRNIADFHVEPQSALACLRSLVAGESLRNAPAQLRHKDGSIRDVLISSNGFRIDGEFMYARCFSRDVTAQVRVEQRLREELDAWEILRRTHAALNSELDSERLMKTILDAAVELTHAQYGALLHMANDGEQPGLRLCAGGEPPPQFPLLLGAEVLAPTLRGERTVRCEDLRRSGPPADPRCNPIRSYLAVPLKARSGDVQGGVYLAHPDAGVFTRRDELVVEGIAAQASIAIENARLFQLNERAREELHAFNETLEHHIIERTEALYRSERQLDQLLSGIADYAIYLLDADGLVRTWNTGAERIHGYVADEVIGRSFTLFHTPEDRAAGLPERALDAARAEGKYEADGWRIHKDGTRFWANVLLEAIHNRDGEVVGFAKVTRDMTERRAIEEQLHRAQRMEAVGRMTGGVAHDFNNLLTIVIGNVDEICRERELRPKVRTAAEHALRGAQRAAALTAQLLAFSRRQTLNPRPTDINRLVAGTAELLKRTFGEPIAISTDLCGDSAACEVDAAQLENALINLAMNARDAMPSGGRLTISTAIVRLDERHAPAHEQVTVAIADTGVGMSAEVREHAFEPFFTTKPPGRGTGLGLSQVYGFIKQSGGRVTLSSEPGVGTVVTIFLPRLDAQVADDAQAAPQEECAGSGTILLVEDNEDVRRYSAGMLRELGFCVLEAADGETALDLLERHHDVRLLFTDIGLPGMDGQELAAHARARDDELRVLFTTGYAHHALEQSVRGGEGLLRKPYTRAQLARALREVLAEGDESVTHLRALLVEDDALLRSLTARMLAQMRFEVGEAESVSTALELIGRGQPFDIALIDRQLSDGDGLAVAAAVRAAHPSTPVLLTSGFGDLPAAESGVIAGTLCKPYGYDALAGAIARLGVHPEDVRQGLP